MSNTVISFTQQLEKFLAVRNRTLTLVEGIRPEDAQPQAAVFVSPTKWHLAHTTWFFEQMLLTAFLPDYKVYDEQFCFLFNSYYNSIGDRVKRADRGIITRPGLQEIIDYRLYVDKHLSQWLETVKLTREQEQLLELGLQHEQQHQELMITDLKYTLSLHPFHPNFRKEGALIHQKSEDQKWISIEEGIYTIGFNEDGFCFDNELGRHRIFLEPFQIQRELVTYGEYFDFIEAGGYEDFRFWLDEGWAWVNETQCTHPLYWKKRDGNWQHYTLGGLEKIHPDDFLCHINYYEAQAFATWKGKRLPTEFEWEVASDQLRWGDRWEWTQSAYLPYPGFKIPEGAVGEYNGKFMVNQMVLRGASAATAPGHSRSTYRNFFHPQYQWQFSGIRLAQSI